MNDGLNVHQFRNDSDSKISMDYMNKSAIKKISRRKLNLKGLAMILTISGGITVVGASAYHENQYEQVEHRYDTYSEGQIEHNHELNKKTFVQDYKIVNEKATEKDVLDAIYDGQYQYYVDHDGKVKIDKDLQGKSIENNEVIAFSNDFLEKHGGKGMK